MLIQLQVEALQVVQGTHLPGRPWVHPALVFQVQGLTDQLAFLTDRVSLKLKGFETIPVCPPSPSLFSISSMVVAEGDLFL